MKKNILFISLFVAVALGGGLLERTGRFNNAIRVFRNRELPSPLLNFGRRGQIFEKMGLKYVVPVSEDKVNNGICRISLDLSKLDSREEWIEPGKLAPDKMISTVIIDKKAVESGVPVLSMYMNEQDLYDRFTGIYANPLERGRNWERPCFISFFRKGELIFASGAGARIHGGTSRSHTVKSFRLYFRDIYGKNQFAVNSLFNGDGDPVRDVVVRKADESFGFVNSMAYEIARKAGCYAPLTEPVKFYLNGKPHGHGNFEMIERMKMDYIETHFGHRNFVFYKVKGRKNRPPEYQQLYEWIRFSGQKFTLENASERIDINNFITMWIVNIFCGNSDPYQGVALLDKTKSGSKWFWLMWDMDHSFKNIYEPDKKYCWEKERPVNLVYSNKKKEIDPRYFLFREMIFNDENFRNLFKKKMEEKLNYILTKDFLISVVDNNISVARSFGMDMTKADYELHEFMNKRPEYIMKMMNKFFKLGDVKRINFRILSNRPLLVDGFKMTKNFTGYYFSGSEITIAAYERPVSGWRINGIVYKEKTLTIPVKGDVVVEAIP